MKETELAKPVISWLIDQHWNVYQEVQFYTGGSIADIVAERHGFLWIIESKNSYGFAVLKQASRWPVHYRSVAVPYSKDHDYQVAKDYYQVGVIEVIFDMYDCATSVIENASAPLIVKNHETIKRYRNKLTDLHKTFCPAGSFGSQHLTAYKLTIMQVRKTIENNPGCTIQFLYEKLGKMHYASAASFKGSLIKSLRDFESDWCRIDTDSRPIKLYLQDNK